MRSTHDAQISALQHAANVLRGRIDAAKAAIRDEEYLDRGYNRQRVEALQSQSVADGAALGVIRTMISAGSRLMADQVVNRSLAARIPTEEVA